MIILDTQYVSQLQRENSLDATRLEAWLTRVASSEVWITVITPYEQLRESLGRIHSARSAQESLKPFHLFRRLLEHYSERWPNRILPFDIKAAAVYSTFDAKLIRRIGPRDGKITAIALSHRATLLSANLADFRQVPGLVVEDWLREDASAQPERSHSPPTHRTHLMRPRLTQTSLGRLMFLIVMFALALAFVRFAFRYWGPVEITVSVYAFYFLTTAAAWFCSPRWKTIVIAFLLSSWSYLIVSRMPEGRHLPTTPLLNKIHDRLDPPVPTQDWDDLFATNRSLTTFMEMGHSVISLCFGLLGGLLALIVAPGKDHMSREKFPADGRLLRESTES